MTSFGVSDQSRLRLGGGQTGGAADHCIDTISAFSLAASSGTERLEHSTFGTPACTRGEPGPNNIFAIISPLCYSPSDGRTCGTIVNLLQLVSQLSSIGSYVEGTVAAQLAG
jgi:hypothetical protein